MEPPRIVEVDERDSNWESSRPRFRVYLHEGQREAMTSATMMSTVCYDVTGADVLQVIDWAQSQVDEGGTYAVALVVDDAQQASVLSPSGRGLVWLVGTDGTNSDPSDPTADDQARMLARMAEPVVVPSRDRMPATRVEPMADGEY